MECDALAHLNTPVFAGPSCSPLLITLPWRPRRDTSPAEVSLSAVSNATLVVPPSTPTTSTGSAACSVHRQGDDVGPGMCHMMSCDMEKALTCRQHGLLLVAAVTIPMGLLVALVGV